jgi:hypothetical protein
VISHFDLAEACQFLNLLIALGEVSFSESGDTMELRRALTLASIVAYARPFKKSRGAPLTASRIDVTEIVGLSEPELQLHELILMSRDRAFAHSDAELTQFDYNRRHPNGPMPTINDPRVAFTRNQAKALHALAAKVSTWTASWATRISGVPIMESRRNSPRDV